MPSDDLLEEIRACADALELACGDPPRDLPAIIGVARVVVWKLREKAGTGVGIYTREERDAAWQAGFRAGAQACAAACGGIEPREDAPWMESDRET